MYLFRIFIFLSIIVFTFSCGTTNNQKSQDQTRKSGIVVKPDSYINYDKSHYKQVNDSLKKLPGWRTNLQKWKSLYGNGYKYKSEYIDVNSNSFPFSQLDEPTTKKMQQLKNKCNLYKLIDYSWYYESSSNSFRLYGLCIELMQLKSDNKKDFYKADD